MSCDALLGYPLSAVVLRAGSVWSKRVVGGLREGEEEGRGRGEKGRRRKGEEEGEGKKGGVGSEGGR